jgi:hypothetical protein
LNKSKNLNIAMASAPIQKEEVNVRCSRFPPVPEDGGSRHLYPFLYVEVRACPRQVKEMRQAGLVPKCNPSLTRRPSLASGADRVPPIF